MNAWSEAKRSSRSRSRNLRNLNLATQQGADVVLNLAEWSGSVAIAILFILLDWRCQLAAWCRRWFTLKQKGKANEFKIIKQKLFSSRISSRSDGKIDSYLIPHPSLNCFARKKGTDRFAPSTSGKCSHDVKNFSTPKGNSVLMCWIHLFLSHQLVFFEDSSNANEETQVRKEMFRVWLMKQIWVSKLNSSSRDIDDRKGATEWRTVGARKETSRLSRFIVRYKISS